MLSVFNFAINAIFPIIILIFLGYILRRINFFNDNFLAVANKFVFRVALPVLLFYNVYEIENLSSIEWTTVAFALIIIFLFFIIGFICVKYTVKDNRQKGVILQSFFRSNYALIGFPLSEALGGADCLGITAVLSAFTIPAFNILAVISLTVFIDGGDMKHINIKSILLKIIKNPLIIGVFCGLFALFIRSLIPVSSPGIPVFSIKNNLPFIYTALSYISKIASPLALIVLGGQFRFKAIKALLPQIVYGTLVRTVLAPAAALTISVLLSKNTSIINFSASHYASLVALFGSPIAVSSAIMATEMNNDSELAGQLVVWTSIVSMFTLFIIIMVMKAIQLL